LTFPCHFEAKGYLTFSPTNLTVWLSATWQKRFRKKLEGSQIVSLPHSLYHTHAHTHNISLFFFKTFTHIHSFLAQSLSLPLTHSISLSHTHIHNILPSVVSLVSQHTHTHISLSLSSLTLSFFFYLPYLTFKNKTLFSISLFWGLSLVIKGWLSKGNDKFAFSHHNRKSLKRIKIRSTYIILFILIGIYSC